MELVRDLSEEGIENLAIGLYSQAKQDYVKGGAVFYRIYGYVPSSEKQARDDHRSNKIDFKNKTPDGRRVRWFFDALRLFEKDPYGFLEFHDITSKDILEFLKMDIKMEYLANMKFGSEADARDYLNKSEFDDVRSYLGVVRAKKGVYRISKNHKYYINNA